jgi:hypothetical protein
MYRFGGEGEIRTHETCEGPPVFKTGAFNRSATSPTSNGRARCVAKFYLTRGLHAALREGGRPNALRGVGCLKLPDIPILGARDIDFAHATLR